MNWAYDRMVGGSFNPTSTYYYFWAAEKGLTVSGDDGLGAIYTENFGDRVPAMLGYLRAAGQYFDFAYTLLQWQNRATVSGVEMAVGQSARLDRTVQSWFCNSCS